MPAFINLEGKKFGRWTVIRRAKNGKHGQPQWVCVCKCKTKKIVLGGNLRRGSSCSCGCLGSGPLPTHGKYGTPIYTCWTNMLHRCRNPDAVNYLDYGGRGITVCKRWHKFQNFYADMGDRPPGRSIDRINNDKGYSKTNCRWATQSQQNANRRAHD